MWRAACVSKPPSQIGCILSLAASRSRTSRASSLRRSVRSCTSFPLCVAVPNHARPAATKVTVSAIQPLIIGCGPAKINEQARSMSARLHDQLIHPGRHHHVHRHAVWPGHQKKVAPFCRFQVVHLLLGQIEGPLQLDGFGMLLGTEKKDAGIGCEDGPVFGFEKIARVLTDQDQAAAILSNAASKSDKEAPDWLVFQQKTHLIDQEVARPAISTQRRPQPIGEQQACRRNELLAQVAKVEPDDIRPKVNVCRCTEESS